VSGYRTPWDPEPAPEAPPPAAPQPSRAKRRGRRPRAEAAPITTSPPWLYHHLTVSGPAGQVADFAAAARGAGVIPWRVDAAQIEEELFALAVAQPPARRGLTVEGCHILARRYRTAVEARQARALNLVGRSRACPFDLHALLPVPGAILALGPGAPTALSWLREHWGTEDGLRQVVLRPDATAGRRLPAGHAVIGYGFFTGGATPEAAVTRLAARWPSLRFTLRPRPPD
jgi:hypothetical protein